MISKEPTEVKAYRAGEVVYLLRKLLGPLREWSDFLGDCRKGRTHYKSNQLLPAFVAHDGSMKRPFYLGKDIADFVRAVTSSCPEAKVNLEVQSFLIKVDPSDVRLWNMKKLSLPKR